WVEKETSPVENGTLDGEASPVSRIVVREGNLPVARSWVERETSPLKPIRRTGKLHPLHRRGKSPRRENIPRTARSWVERETSPVENGTLDGETSPVSRIVVREGNLPVGRIFPVQREAGWKGKPPRWRTLLWKERTHPARRAWLERETSLLVIPGCIFVFQFPLNTSEI
ncbi:hypothetical protein PM082_002434, partial [Marasmius tenuissimus]